MSMLATVLEQPQPTKRATEKRSKILIIDDDDALADVLSRRLQKQGYETIAAESGHAGRAKARSARPALIVLDLRLPDTDGFSLCEQLADCPQTCAIPVIILSGLEEPDILRRCRSAGCRYYLRKPYDPNALLVLIREAIREAAEWDELFD